MRRRRKSRVTWFPGLGSQFLGNRFTNFNFEQLIPELSDGTQPSQGNGSLFCTPLTRDYTAQAIAGSTASSLRDYVEGQDYVLKRIVGSIFVNVRPSTSTQANTVVWDRILVTCGFLVARAEEVSQIAVDLDDVEVDPQAVDNIANPWIWRRSWMLGNPNITGLATSSSATTPTSNMVYGGNMSGPFIDSKVSRRITKEHRLWFTGSCLGLSDAALVVTGAKASQPLANVWANLRILGSMRRGKNLSTF